MLDRLVAQLSTLDDRKVSARLRQLHTQGALTERDIITVVRLLRRVPGRETITWV